MEGNEVVIVGWILKASHVKAAISCPIGLFHFISIQGNGCKIPSLP